MKLFIFIAFIVVVILAYAAQAQRCPGEPGPSCRGRRNDGRDGEGCQARVMWFYNQTASSCQEMNYRGCGGNRNRHCTRAMCETACRR